jgi:hypothetical protein
VMSMGIGVMNIKTMGANSKKMEIIVVIIMACSLNFIFCSSFVFSST